MIELGQSALRRGSWSHQFKMPSPHYTGLSGLGCCSPERIYDESAAIRYDVQKLLRSTCYPLALDVVVASVTLAGIEGIVLEGGGRGPGHLRREFDI